MTMTDANVQTAGNSQILITTARKEGQQTGGVVKTEENKGIYPLGVYYKCS